MARLRFREKQVLEEFLEMDSGYVLDLSDRTFAEFFRDFGIDIDAAEYREGHSGSKANRMRSYWDAAEDHALGEVLAELIEYAESNRAGHAQADAARGIAARLLATGAAMPTQRAAPNTAAATRPAGATITARPIEIFFSYAHEDEELMDTIRLQLVVRERLGQIVKWHDRKIPAGDEWRREIDDRIERAHVILLFMSPHFLASRYCYEVEGEIALRRHTEGTARVIPVVLRPCDWTITPFGELQALPQDAVPITEWPDRDRASLDVAQGIMRSIRPER